MAKIVKAADAPEGDLKVSVGNVHFKVDASGYETDDLAVIETVRNSFSEFLSVEVDGDSDPKAAARAEAKVLNELHKTQEQAEKARAEKAPTDPAPYKPTSVADLDTDSEGDN